MSAGKSMKMRRRPWTLLAECLPDKESDRGPLLPLRQLVDEGGLPMAA